MNRWRPAVPVILVGILGLVAVSPVLILGDPTAPAGTVLELDAVPATENAVHWSEGAQTPTDLRTAALADAFRLLTVLGWIAFATSLVVINQHLAQRYFQGGQALGRGLYLRRGFWRRPYIVVGVVDDHPANAFGAGHQPYAALYLPVLQHPPARAELLVRPRENATADSAARIRTLAAGILGPDAVGPMESLVTVRTREARHVHWFGVGFAGTGLAALLIALVGVAGSSAAWVRSRAFELALRRAVGASRRDVTRFVLWRVTGLIAGGTLLGLFAYATVLRRPLAAALPGLAPWAPDAALAAAATMGGAAALAALRTLADLRAEPPASRLQ